jgi:hypothetical protein
LSISASNYDLLVQMSIVVGSFYGQSVTDSFGDFVSKGISTNDGLREALTRLFVTDTSWGMTSLATRSPFLTEIQLPDMLPELYGVVWDQEMALAISFRQGLIVGAHSTVAGLWRPNGHPDFVQPLSRSSLRKVRRTLSAQIKAADSTRPPNMGAQYLRDKFDSYIV